MHNMSANEQIKHLRRCSILMCCTHTSGLPCLLTSICANEHTSPTPTTSTVKFLKKSTISRDLYLKLKHKRNGVIMGLTSSWITNSWKHMRKQKQIQNHSSISWSKTFQALYNSLLIVLKEKPAFFIYSLLYTERLGKTFAEPTRQIGGKGLSKNNIPSYDATWGTYSTHNTNTKQTKTTPLLCELFLSKHQECNGYEKQLVLTTAQDPTLYSITMKNIKRHWKTGLSIIVKSQNFQMKVYKPRLV